MAMKARKKMEEIAGTGKAIHMQIVPIAARMDEDMKRNEDDTEEQRKEKEKNKRTRKIFGRSYVYNITCSSQ